MSHRHQQQQQLAVAAGLLVSVVVLGALLYSRRSIKPIALAPPPTPPPAEVVDEAPAAAVVEEQEEAKPTTPVAAPAAAAAPPSLPPIEIPAVTRQAITALLKLLQVSKAQHVADQIAANKQLQTKLFAGQISKADWQRLGVHSQGELRTLHNKLVAKQDLVRELAGAEQFGDLPGAVFLALLVKTSREASQACRVIAELANDEDGTKQTKLGQLGACEAVINCYQQFAGQDLDVLFLACTAIALLSLMNEANLQKFAQLGAANCVVDALRRVGTVDPLASQRVCFALSVLACDAAGNRPQIVRLGGTEAAFDAVNRFGRGDVQVAQYGLAALQQLVEEDEVKIKLLRLGAPQLLVGLMQQQHAAGDVMREACGLIQNMAADSSGRIQFLLGVAGVCEHVVGALKTHGLQRGDTQLCQYACGAMQNLSVYAVNQDKLGAAGACEAVVQVLQKYGATDGHVAYFGCAALRHLAVNSANLAKLRAVNAVDVVQRCEDTECKQSLLDMLQRD